MQHRLVNMGSGLAWYYNIDELVVACTDIVTDATKRMKVYTIYYL